MFFEFLNWKGYWNILFQLSRHTLAQICAFGELAQSFGTWDRWYMSKFYSSLLQFSTMVEWVMDFAFWHPRGMQISISLNKFKKKLTVLIYWKIATSAIARADMKIKSTFKSMYTRRNSLHLNVFDVDRIILFINSSMIEVSDFKSQISFHI